MGKRIYRFQPREGVLLEKADFTGLDRRTVVVVPPGVLAFFVRDGIEQDPLSGGGSAPVFRNSGYLAHRKSPEVVEAIFLNEKGRMKVPWGTRNGLHAPVFRKVVPCGAHGVLEIGIKNARRFYQKVCASLPSYRTEDVQDLVLSLFLPEIGKIVLSSVAEGKTDLLAPERSLPGLSEECKEALGRRFEDDYGLSILSFVVEKISLPPEERAALEGLRSRNGCCPECGAILPSLEGKCPSCGKEILRCSHCGNVLVGESAHCTSCGILLKEQGVSEQKNNQQEGKTSQNPVERKKNAIPE